MLLGDYLAEFFKLINEYAQANLVVSSDVKNDFRTETLGLIKANIVFIDESMLYITEYLDGESGINKTAYSYHYQKKNGKLLFRYDNARHKPHIGFTHHKHCSDGTIAKAGAPDLRKVFEEVLEYLL